jgi:hypothetical protein
MKDRQVISVDQHGDHEFTTSVESRILSSCGDFTISVLEDLAPSKKSLVTLHQGYVRDADRCCFSIDL